MRRRWRAALALAALWLTAGFAVGAAHAEPTAQAFSSRLVDLINQARTQHGLRALTVTSGTSTVAASWTEHLDRAQALSHNPDLGPQLESHGSPDWTMYGENVGDGPTSSADTLFNAYMNSPEHRDNILGSKFRYLGIGVVFDGSTAWNTLDFVDQYGTPTTTAHAARPSSRPRPAAPKPVVSHTPVARPVVAAPPAPRPTPHRVVPAHRPRPAQKPSVQGLALASEPLAAAAAAPSLPAPIRLPHPDRAPVPVLIATAAVVAGVAARYLVELRVLRLSQRVA